MPEIGLLLAAAVVSTAPASGFPPVTLATAAGAAAACVGATHGSARAQVALAAAGWEQGQLSGGDGSMDFFAKDGVVMLVTPGATSERTACTEIAKIDPAVAPRDVLKAYDAAFGKAHDIATDGQAVWLLGGDEAAMLNADNPTTVQGIRLMVVAIPAEGTK